MALLFNTVRSVKAASNEVRSEHTGATGARFYLRLLTAAKPISLHHGDASMNVQLPVFLDTPAFLGWLQGREGRYELTEGRVVMMVGASRAHGILVMNLAAIMRAQLDPGKWTILADFGLETGPKSLRYPDLVVDPAGGGAADYVATAPALIAEVLSPSTVDIDLGDKAAEYLQLPSLSAYLVFAQHESKAWVWSHEADAFPSIPSILVGIDKVIHLAEFQLVMPLGSVYAGVESS
jgi:Uma2 family endonuclease